MSHYDYYLLQALTGWNPTLITIPKQISSPNDLYIDFYSLESSLPDRVTHVSFDVFDTVLRRQVHPPEATKEPALSWLYSYLNKFDSHITFPELKLLRDQAESTARQQALEKGWDSECTLQDIFVELIKHVKTTLNKTFIPDIIDTLIDIEIFTELNQLSAMPNALESLKSLRKCGIKISFISDMYLHKEHIHQFLIKEGLFVEGDNLYVSSEEKLTKGSGRLFEKLIQEGLITPQTHCHIGDHPISDVKQAKACGLHAIQFYSEDEERRKSSTEKYRKLALYTGDYQALYSSSLPDNNSHSPLYQLAYKKLAPIFALFAQHVYQQACKQDYDRIFFLARDGYLPHKIFSQLVAQLPLSIRKQLPPSQYLYLSRASTRYVAFSGDKGEILSLAQRVNRQDGVWALIKTLGLNVEDYQAIVRQILGNNYQPHEDMEQTSQEIRTLLDNTEFQAKVSHDLKTNTQRLLDYLKQEGWLGSQRILVVDIGWNGSIFSSLEKAFDQRDDWPTIDVQLFGHLPNPDIHSTNILPGFAMDMRHPHPIESLINECRELFEVSTSSLEGSVLGYEQNGAHIAPLTSQRLVNQGEKRSIEQLQQGILEGNQHIAQMIQNSILDPNVMRANAIIQATSLLTGLHSEEVKALSSLQFDLSWGTDGRVSMAEYLGYTAGNDQPSPNFNKEHLQLKFDDGSSTNTAKPQKVLENLHQVIEMLKAEGDVILYGVGTATSLIAPLIDEHIVYFVDGNTALHGKNYQGKPVYSPDHAMHDNTTLFVTPIGRKNVISNRLSGRLGKTLYIDDYL